MVKRVFDTDSCTVSIQEGQGVGQLIDHLHVHVIPRSCNDKYTDSDMIYEDLAKFDDM